MFFLFLFFFVVVVFAFSFLEKKKSTVHLWCDMQQQKEENESVSKCPSFPSWGCEAPCCLTRSFLIWTQLWLLWEGRLRSGCHCRCMLAFFWVLKPFFRCIICDTAIQTSRFLIASLGQKLDFRHRPSSSSREVDLHFWLLSRDAGRDWICPIFSSVLWQMKV